MSFNTEQAAIDYLTAEGFTPRGDGYYGLRAMTQGTYGDFPCERLHLATVHHNRVDPKWNAPDYFTIDWH